MQGVRVQSLGGELGSHMLHGLTPTKKKKTKYFLYHAYYVTFQCAPRGAGQLSIYPGRNVAEGMSMNYCLYVQLKLSSSRSSMHCLSHRDQADQLRGFPTYKETRHKHSVMEAVPSTAWENLCWMRHQQDLVVFTGAQSISKSRVETRSLESQHLTSANTTMTWRLSAGPDSGN